MSLISFLFVFNHDFIIYTHFISIEASTTVTDDVTN